MKSHNLAGALAIATLGLSAIVNEGCHLFPTQPDMHWETVAHKRMPHFYYQADSVGVRLVDGAWRYFILGGIANQDSVDIRVNGVYTDLYLVHADTLTMPAFQRDEGYAGNALPTMPPAQGLARSDTIPPLSLGDPWQSFRYALVEGPATWKPGDTVVANFYITCDSVAANSSTELVRGKIADATTPGGHGAHPIAVQMWYDAQGPRIKLLGNPQAREQF